jgi:hypothetical protein
MKGKVPSKPEDGKEAHNKYHRNNLEGMWKTT